MRSTRAGTRLTHSSDCCALGVTGHVLLQHWFGPVGLDDAKETLAAHEVAHEHAAQVDVLVVVEGVPSLPDAATRKLLGEIAAKTKGEVRAHATVIHADGFTGSALRSVLTAIFAMSGSTYPKKVFSTLPEASAWLAGGPGTGSNRLQSAFEQLAIARSG